MLDLLCQKLADQALHLKDLVKEAIEPGGMAKTGMEYCDGLTPTSETSGSSGYSGNSNDFDEEDESCSSYDVSGEDQDEKFPIMMLPVEVQQPTYIIKEWDIFHEDIG